MRSGGAETWRTAVAKPRCAVTWRALDLTCTIPITGTEIVRRAGLARAAEWLGRLPPRLAIEQAAALNAAAESLGYDSDAVRRAFSARYWPRDAGTRAIRENVIVR